MAIRSSDGQRPVEGARVRLDADPASLGAIGSFRLPPDDREVPAAGALRVEATTKATGAASFGRLPFGRYRALVAPPAGMADAATTVATIEVRAGMAPPAINLVRPVKLTGRLLSTGPLLTAGLKLLAIETDGPSPGEALAATAGDLGQFSFSVAPGRTYRLQIEPAQERKLPRLFLGPHTAGMVDSVYGDVTLSEGVLFIGVVTNGSAPVADAVVQIFCTGAPPDCMAESVATAGFRPAAGRDPRRPRWPLPGVPAQPGQLGPVIIMTHSSPRPAPVCRRRAGDRRTARGRPAGAGPRANTR